MGRNSISWKNYYWSDVASEVCSSLRKYSVYAGNTGMAVATTATVSGGCSTWNSGSACFLMARDPSENQRPAVLDLSGDVSRKPSFMSFLPINVFRSPDRETRSRLQVICGASAFRANRGRIPRHSNRFSSGVKAKRNTIST